MKTLDTKALFDVRDSVPPKLFVAGVVFAALIYAFGVASPSWNQ